MGSIQSVRQQFDVAKQSTLAATQALIAKTAKAKHAEVMQADPRPASFKRIVDGVVGAAEEAVRPDGMIIYDYDRLNVVADFALQTLRDKSPVGGHGDKHPGLYRDSHTLFLNEKPVADLGSYKTGDEIAIANLTPYSRKIEVGGMTMTVPGTDHVYQQAQQIVAGRYGNIASVEFTYRGLIGLSSGSGTFVNPGNDPTRSTARGRSSKTGTKAYNKSDVRFPCLVITER